MWNDTYLLFYPSHNIYIFLDPRETLPCPNLSKTDALFKSSPLSHIYYAIKTSDTITIQLASDTITANSTECRGTPSTIQYSSCYAKVLRGKRVRRFCCCCTRSSSLLSITNSLVFLHGWKSMR